MTQDIAFLVEGELEKRFIQQVCPNSPVRRVVINGVTVSLSAIVERVLPHYRLLQKRCRHIILVLDREGRQQTWQQIRDELTSLLNDNGCSNVVIGVCNRKIENWILSDPSTVNLDIIDDPESFGGKGKIAELLGEYHETTTGVDLLKKAKPSVMKLNSPSFDDFFSRAPLSNCHWASR